MRTPWQIQKSVVFALFIRELRTRFGSYKGGYLWLLVEPLAHVIVMSTIFSIIRKGGIHGMDVPVFIVTGIVPFLLFKNIALRVMEGVNANHALFAYRQIRPMDTFVARTVLDSVLSLLVFCILLTGMAWLGLNVTIANPLVILFVYALLILFGLGLGMIFCVLAFLMPEAATFFRIIFMPLYFISGIIFPIAAVPSAFTDYLLWNPLLHAIELLRSGFFQSYHLIPGINLFYLMMTTLVVLFLGLSLYQRKRYQLMAS